MADGHDNDDPCALSGMATDDLQLVKKAEV